MGWLGLETRPRSQLNLDTNLDWPEQLYKPTCGGETAPPPPVSLPRAVPSGHPALG